MDGSSADGLPFDEIDPQPDVDNWLDLIDEITGELAESDECLECKVDELTLDVPMQMSPEADTARWRFDGGVTISLGEVRVPLREWQEYWNDTE
ncbi:MAG: hypothetical protein J07HN4v3_02871 [Halonotius sp. J07HN4]|jgi:hypothetical protein|nr:MAG: hypothetical protein J07HN4v3_02871 [Halonotius sp. J07HN4]ESS07905.1 MAG: hypothetical protein A07HN63_02410 [uncultured archaeon A07HN63]